MVALKLFTRRITMSLKILALALISGVSLGATAAHADGSNPAPQPPELEVIYGFVTSPTDLTVQVYSGGCTNREDFAVAVIQPRCLPTPGCDSRKRVTIVREKPDLCRGFFPHGELIRFSLAESGLDMTSFILQNPVANPFVTLQSR
jgi:hypothetical protein